MGKFTMNKILVIAIVVATCLTTNECFSLTDKTKISQELLEKLSKLDEVGGRVVGDGGDPGEFYKLSLEILRVGELKDFLILLNDSRPISRAMGLVCVTKTDKKAAFIELKKRLESQDRFTCFPGGCTGFEITEGNFCWELLHNSQFLELTEENEWLSLETLLEIDLKVLSADNCHTFHYSACATSACALEEAFRPESFHELKRRLGALTDLEAIKGLGRTWPNKFTRELLMQCVLDENLPSEARLAAASGLTRDWSAGVPDFLRVNGGVLLKLAPELPDGFFSKRGQERAIHAAATENYCKLRRQHYDEEMDDQERAASEKRLKQAFIESHLNDCPVAIKDLISALSSGYLDDDPKLAQEFVHRLDHATARVFEVARCWDTDSNHLLTLDEYLAKPNKTVQRYLSPSDINDALRNVQSAIEKLQADCKHWERD